MSFKYVSEAVHWLTAQRYPDYLITAEGSYYWEACNDQVWRATNGLDHNLTSAEQINILDIIRCGEPKHLNMLKGDKTA